MSTRTPMRLMWLAWSLLCASVVQAVDEDTGVARQYQAAGSLSGPLSPRTEWRVAGFLFWNGNSALYAHAAQGGLTWSANHWLSLNGAYRLSHVEDGAGAWNRQRAIGSASLAAHRDKWGVAYRLFWQGDWRDPGEKGFRDRYFVRNQVQVRYTGFERVAPYVAMEVWHRLDPHRTSSGVDRSRYTLGAESRLTRYQSLGMYVRKQTYGNGDPNLFVFATEYAYSFH